MQEIGNYIIKKIRERSQLQGHTLTGAFEAGLRAEVEEQPFKIILRGIDETGVGKYIDVFTPADRIPFSPGSGAPPSKFIQGLKRYAELRFGISGKEALGRAFAIAHTMKKEGRPTRGSYQFSRNNKRTEVITGVLEDEKENIRRMINDKVHNFLKIEFTNMIRKQTETWQ